MTPWNLTDLLNKDTGDASGEIAFTLMERAMPMFCRHNPTSSDCKATHGWLMDSNLVYAVHTVEAAVWGPFMPCNIDPEEPNAPFKCESARAPVAVKDISRCEPSAGCNRTATHAGWNPLSQMGSRYRPLPEVSKTCATAAEKICNGTATAFDHGRCGECVLNHKAIWHQHNCTEDALVEAWCPPYKPVPSRCKCGFSGTTPALCTERATCGVSCALRIIGTYLGESLLEVQFNHG
jgi:hypothetical protein